TCVTAPKSGTKNSITKKSCDCDHNRIPREDPSGKSVILPPAEFQRITSTSRMLVKEAREAKKQVYQREKEEEAKAAEERRNMILKAELSRKDDLSETELEARDKDQRLVERAFALTMEEEDEVKKLNQLILDAQCQAIRDVQIQEKKQIHAEVTGEEKRLDSLMETERRKALETMEKIEEQQKQQKMKGMKEICEQIDQRLEEKQLQDELKDQESHQIREQQEKMTWEDFQALKKKREDQLLLQEEIKRINAETMRAKEQRMEQEKQADMRDLEYIQKKLEREAEFDAELKRNKKQKELEIARLRAKQERARDYKAEQDELRARRNQQEMDREWRRKVKEMAAKKARDEASLRAARMEQVLNRERCLSMEAGREKAEFDRVVRAQQEAAARQREQDEKQYQEALRHAQRIRKQMQERELSAVAQRRDFFREADRMAEENRKRQLRLNQIKEKKLKELRATGLSDKYCKEVERKARICLG
uniref:Cilia- and flagella-associated protein 45 n=1 Tax=Gouania willdenowi TaxID=441366 RepID=A0A8C5I2X0_GOUWI